MTQRETILVKCEELTQNVKATTARFQSMSLDASDLLEKVTSKADSLEDNFKTIITTQVADVDKLVKILRRMLGENAANDKLPKVLALMEQCDSRDEKIQEYAVKLRYVEKTTKRKRKA